MAIKYSTGINIFCMVFCVVFRSSLLQTALLVLPFSKCATYNILFQLLGKPKDNSWLKGNYKANRKQDFSRIKICLSI